MEKVSETGGTLCSNARLVVVVLPFSTIGDLGATSVKPAHPCKPVALWPSQIPWHAVRNRADGVCSVQTASAAVWCGLHFLAQSAVGV